MMMVNFVIFFGGALFGILQMDSKMMKPVKLRLCTNEETF